MIELNGKAVVLADHVNTDVIAPGRWKLEGMEVLKAHCLEAIVPDFGSLVSPGDILVAGEDFGCGSHREQAVTVLWALGIRGILADSVSRLYYRNCIALGMPILAIPGVSALVKAGDRLQVKLDEGEIVVVNQTTGEKKTAPPLPKDMLTILEDGGILLSLKKEMENRNYELNPKS